MKKYEKPKFILVLLDEQDVCTTSGNAVNDVGGEPTGIFEDYDFGGDWM